MIQKSTEDCNFVCAWATNPANNELARHQYHQWETDLLDYSCDQFRTTKKWWWWCQRRIYELSTLGPVKHLSLLINPWEKLCSYLQHTCMVTWPPRRCCRSALKGGAGTVGMHTPSSNPAPQQQSKNQSEKNLSPIAMRTVLAAVAVLVLALGWTSEAVHVEVKCPSELPSLSRKSRNQTWKSACCSWRPCPLWLCVLSTALPLHPPSRRTAWPSLWRPSRGFRSCRPAPARLDRRAPVCGPPPCPSAATPCCRRSSCPSASRGAPPRRSPGWVSGAPSDSVAKVHVGWSEVSHVLFGFFLLQSPSLWTSVRSAPSPPAPAAEHIQPLLNVPTPRTRPPNQVLPPLPCFRLVIFFSFLWQHCILE